LIFDVLTFDAPRHAEESWEEEMRGRILRRLENPEEPIADNLHQILDPVIQDLCPRLADLGGGQVKFSCYSPPQSVGTRYAISRLLSERTGASILSIVRDGTRDWPVPRTNFYIRIASDVSTVAAALREELGDVPIDLDAMA
jgi:hypothetical protein